MSPLDQLHSDLLAAQHRLDALTAEAEMATDRGTRGPSPKDIARERDFLGLCQRRVDLARETIRQPMRPAMGRAR